MKSTDLVNSFEQEWMPKYPDLQYFTVDAVISDIAHRRNLLLTANLRDSLSDFFLKYLQEHSDRFKYVGLTGFMIVANIPKADL